MWRPTTVSRCLTARHNSIASRVSFFFLSWDSWGMRSCDHPVNSPQDWNRILYIGQVGCATQKYYISNTRNIEGRAMPPFRTATHNLLTGLIHVEECVTGIQYAYCSSLVKLMPRAFVLAASTFCIQSLASIATCDTFDISHCYIVKAERISNNRKCLMRV